MTNQEFVKKLKNIPASFETYRILGVSDDFIREHLNGFDLKRKEGGDLIFYDEVLELTPAN